MVAEWSLRRRATGALDARVRQARRLASDARNLAKDVERLRAAGARFRNDIVKGNGGQQILLDDPSGNPGELFRPDRR